MRRTRPKRLRQGETRRISRQGLPARPDTVANSLFLGGRERERERGRERAREAHKERTTGGQERASLACCHLYTLTGCHGHAGVLRSSRLPAGPFPLGVQLLSLIGPFDCAWWCHVFMLPCCHLDTRRRTTRG